MKVVSKKKTLEKAIQNVSNQKFGSTDTTLQREAIESPTVHESCIPNSRDRGRVIVFIDSANLFYAASQLGIRIDYVKLLHYLTARDYVVHVFFYVGHEPTNKKQNGFLHWMRHHGFRVITKAVTQAENGAKSANLDIEIAVDMVRLAQYCDTAVLVSGDGDFAYVVNTIAGQGVQVEVVGLRSMTSSSLIDAADCYIDLASIQEVVKVGDGVGV